MVWLREGTSFIASPAAHQQVIDLAEGLTPTCTSSDTTSAGLVMHSHDTGEMSRTAYHMCVRLPALCSLRTGHTADVGGPMACCSTNEVIICAFQDLCNVTSTSVSPMLHRFCAAGNRDIGQSQHWQSWKYDVTEIAFVFWKVHPRLWTREQFAFSAVSRPTKNPAVSQGWLWISTHSSGKLCRQPLEVNGRRKAEVEEERNYKWVLVALLIRLPVLSTSNTPFRCMFMLCNTHKHGKYPVPCMPGSE